MSQSSVVSRQCLGVNSITCSLMLICEINVTGLGDGFIRGTADSIFRHNGKSCLCAYIEKQQMTSGAKHMGKFFLQAIQKS